MVHGMPASIVCSWELDQYLQKAGGGQKAWRHSSGSNRDMADRQQPNRTAKQSEMCSAWPQTTATA